MAKKIRPSQEESMVKFLKKEGFEQLPAEAIKKEPYKTIYKKPECFRGEKAGAK
jgi:hypothetical protein